MGRYSFGKRIVAACAFFTLFLFYEAYEGLAENEITGRRGVVILSGHGARVFGWEALFVGLMLVGVTIYLYRTYWDG